MKNLFLRNIWVKNVVPLRVYLLLNVPDTNIKEVKNSDPKDRMAIINKIKIKKNIIKSQKNNQFW